jgi:hypothetical protein
MLIFLSFSLLLGYFWHLTDLHFDSAYSTKGDISRSKQKKRRKKNVTWKLFFYWFTIYDVNVHKAVKLYWFFFSLFPFIFTPVYGFCCALFFIVISALTLSIFLLFLFYFILYFFSFIHSFSSHKLCIIT